MTATRTDEMPPWRAALLAIPPDQCSSYQRDLIRGMELADFVINELDTPCDPNESPQRTLDILLAGAEALVLGPLESSALTLIAVDGIEKYVDFVALANCELAPIPYPNPPSMTPAHALTALLATIQYVLLHPGCPKGPEAAEVFLDVLDCELKALDWRLVVETLAATNGALTVSTLKQVVEHIRADLRISRDMNFEAVEFVVNKFILPATRDAAPSPLTTASVHALYLLICGGPAIDLTIAAYRAVARVLERAVAAAEAEGDDARLAFTASWLAVHLSTCNVGRVNIEDVRAVVDKASAALDRARRFLPRTYKKKITEIIETAADYLHAERHFNGASGVLQPEPIIRTPAPVTLTLRTCAACEVSYECKGCSGCWSRWYCSTSCQKRHWKDEHREECATLKAQAEQEKAEAAEAAALEAEAQAAQEAAAAQARSAPGGANNKKK